MGGQYSEKRLKEIYEAKQNYGLEEAAKKLGLAVMTVKSRGEEYKSRYLNKQTDKKNEKDFSKNSVLAKIASSYSDKELQAIANGGRILPGIDKIPIISFSGKRIRIGCISDTHIGHQQFAEERLYQAFDEFKREGVEFITHSGDVCEGMSHRPGHIYELDQLGYEQQREYAIKIFSQWTDTDIYAIDGNHDRWFIKSNGALVVKDIERRLPNFKFIGHDEGDISLDGRASIKLWHGEDGNSYALSYRIQKIIESLSGGEKPSVLLAGHTHKYVKIFERNITAISVGSIEAQTKWMRGKRISAACGFCILDITLGGQGIAKISDCWYPFYV